MYCTYQGSIKSVDICYFNNYIPREEEREYDEDRALSFVLNKIKEYYEI